MKMERLNTHKSIHRDKSQNIHHLLSDRENGIDRRRYLHRRSPTNFNLEFFKCIPPNLTVSNVEKPHIFIRKFSPDGKHLICFSKDLLSFESYKFLGTANAANLLYKWKTEYIPPESSDDVGKEIRENVFNRLFKKNWSIQLTVFTRPLYREFSIFTEDGKFVIVASYLPVHEDSLPSYYTLHSRSRMQFDYDLNCYQFYMVELSDGSIWDTIDYAYDYINLSHNHGVCTYGNMMAVLSLFHQWINIVQLINGKFVKMFTIGRFFHGTNDCLCSCVPEYQDDCIVLDLKFGGLKQKVLVGLYKNILKFESPAQRRVLLRQFYKKFRLYQDMEIHKIQFIDPDNLLIRYDLNKQQAAQLNPSEGSKIYVVYNLTGNEVTKIYPEKSKQLLWLLSNCFDEFRNIQSLFTGRPPSSVSNNIYLQKAQARILASYPNGELDAVHRLLPQIPMSVQSYSVSPYLDLNLFKYDDRQISSLERPRYLTCEPIRFSDRETGITKFRVHPGISAENLADEYFEQDRHNAAKDLVAYIFHPYEPFLISVQKLPTRYVTNFHVRNEGTFIKM